MTRAYLLITTAAILVASCHKAPQPVSQPAATPAKPKEAASQLQQAFANSDGDAQKVANIASEALKTADYEAAVQSLTAIKQQGNLTPDQGMAVHNSMISLEARLISAAASGDANAQRAYEQLKRSRKN